MLISVQIVSLYFINLISLVKDMIVFSKNET